MGSAIRLVAVLRAATDAALGGQASLGDRGRRGNPGISIDLSWRCAEGGDGDGASRVLEAVQTSIEMAAAFVSFVLRSEPGLMTATSALGATWCLVNSWKKP